VILRGLYEAAKRGLSIGSGFIWEAKKIISKDGDSLAKVPEARELFLKIVLGSENTRVIRLLLELGLITLFIPEFKKLRNLAQFGFYHVMTADLHSLRTLEIIGEIARGVYDKRWGLFREAFELIAHPDWLFLAGLLHDIGKGRGGNHSEKGSRLTPGILQRLDMNDKAGKTISFLVLHHLLLSNISQRRDLNDEKTVVQVAQIVQDVDVLHMLFLLNIADSFATGPMARSDWKIFLLIELYVKVRRVLEKGILATPDATRQIFLKKEAVRNKLSEEFKEEDVLGLIEQVSSRYFLNISSEEMFSHFRMALSLGKNAYLWELKGIRDASVTKVILCTHDKPGLFSRMVGVFTLNNMEILSARIFTPKNGLAFDVFEVTNPPDRFRQDEKWLRTGDDLRAAMENQLPLDELILEKGQGVMAPAVYGGSVKKKVNIDNETSDFFTLIEVRAGSRMGLLYDLAKQIRASGLDLCSAKISSDKERLTGVFYVRDSDGQKIYSEEEIGGLRETLMGVLDLNSK
jgi:[protein-PII] uridylyltransferase